MTEEWKDISGYEGVYQVSSLGRVKSCERKVRVSHRGYSGFRLCKEKIMNPIINNRGYYYFKLRNNQQYKTVLAHRLVAETFIQNPNNLPCVNHKDENPQNNCVNNLEWCTYEYNDNYGNRNQKISESRKGMKFTDEHIENMRKAGKRRVNNAFKEKMRQVHLGTHLSEETKRKISEGLKNHYNNA